MILDPDDEKLKREMLPLLKEDVCENNLSEIINKTSFNLSRDYKIQAKVKNINFFKLTKDDRIPVNEKVSIDHMLENYKEFRKQYEKAVKEKEDIFMFQEQEVLTRFAKYVIEYHEQTRN